MKEVNLVLQMDAFILTLHILTQQPYAAPCTQTDPRPLTVEELQTCAHLAKTARELGGSQGGWGTATTFYNLRTKKAK